MFSLYMNTSKTSFLRATGAPAPVASLIVSSENNAGKQTIKETSRNIYAQTLVVVDLMVVNLFGFVNFTRNGFLHARPSLDTK